MTQWALRLPHLLSNQMVDRDNPRASTPTQNKQYIDVFMVFEAI